MDAKDAHTKELSITVSCQHGGEGRGGAAYLSTNWFGGAAMNKAVLLRGSLVSAVMAVAMKHAGWRDGGLALLSSAFTLSWLWAACQSHSNGDLLRQAQSRRDQLHHLLTRIAYKLRELPPNVQPLNYGLHEEMWTAVSRPPDDGVTGPNPSAGSGTVDSLVGGSES